MATSSLHIRLQQYIRLLSHPRLAWSYLQWKSDIFPKTLPGSLLRESPKRGPLLSHIALYTMANAGDTLLTAVLRDLFVRVIGDIRWQSIHAHREVGSTEIQRLNSTKGIIIGGGGLFLRDTNPNRNSGWQWNCSIESLAKLKTPIALFAVGYNRFRGQEDFDPVFHNHIATLARKSTVIGIREKEGAYALQEYLPLELRQKVIYQPCMTTLLAKIYPELFGLQSKIEPCIALNCAFDRSSMRFGEREAEILDHIAEAVKRLRHFAPIRYYAHCEVDEHFLHVLERHHVPYKLVRLYGVPARQVLAAYCAPILTIGMRGHAQLIPFGCQRPILSLISHDKLKWFLDDIDAPEWGIDIQSDDLAHRIVTKAEEILRNRQLIQDKLRDAQEILWNISLQNIRNIRQDFQLQ